MKILIRSAMNQLKNPSSFDVITGNLVGYNCGNMLFAYSVMRALMTEDTEVDITPTGSEFSDARAKTINETYDAFVLPLANAFRVSFMRELGILTRLIKRLTIPCVVVGVGIQLGVGETVSESHLYDDAVKEFMSAVLEKSSIVGVRGEITGKYLKHLGFVEGKDYCVIGCPAMFTYGENLAVKQVKELTPLTPVSVNRKIGIPAPLHEFLTDASKKFEDIYFVPQDNSDLEMLYFGKTINDKKRYPKIHPTYPSDPSHPMCVRNGKAREIAFTNVPSWLDYMQTRDFSFGSRIHGNIAAVVAGVPAFVFAPDSRIVEIADYHNINYITVDEINSATDIFKIFEATDFNSVTRGHKERFDKYIAFLRQNGLETIYDKPFETCKFDRLFSQMDFEPGISSLMLQTTEEIAERLTFLFDEYNSNRAKVKRLNKANAELKSKIPSDDENAFLGSKAANIARGVRNVGRKMLGRK